MVPVRGGSGVMSRNGAETSSGENYLPLLPVSEMGRDSIVSGCNGDVTAASRKKAKPV